MRAVAKFFVLPVLLAILLIQGVEPHSTLPDQSTVISHNETTIQPILLTNRQPSQLSQIRRLSASERGNILDGYNFTKQVRLSFDDCAAPARLNLLLGGLKKLNVQAIFFFTGVCMAQHPNYRQQILGAHQLLGNHSFDHSDYAKLSDAKIRSQLIRGIKPTTTPMLARPPYGDLAFTVRFYNIAASLYMRPCFWTVDTRDWAGYSAARITHRVLIGESGRNGTPPAKAGGMVLMHGTARHTLEALPGIIRGLRAKHLVLFSLSK